MSLLKKFSSVGAVVAFIRSPTGQMVLGKAKEVVTDPRNRARMADIANKLRRPTVVDQDVPKK